MACDEEGLTGLWFDGQKYFGSGFLKEADPENREEKGGAPAGPVGPSGAGEAGKGRRKRRRKPAQRPENE